MKLTGILKGSLLIAIATVLIAAAPIETSVFAQNTVKTEITKKHKHKHKHGKKKKGTNKSNNTGSNQSKDNGKNTQKDNKTQTKQK